MNKVAALKMLIRLMLLMTVVALKEGNNYIISDEKSDSNINVSPIRYQEALETIDELKNSVAEINSQMVSLLQQQTEMLHQAEASKQKIKYLETTIAMLRKKLSVTPTTSATPASPEPTPDPCRNNKESDISQACPDGVKYGTFCYMFSRFRTTWDRANLYCEALGASQVQINDEHTGIYLRWILQREQKLFNNFWIGAQRDKNNETSWNWFPSGRTFSYFNWDRPSYDATMMETGFGCAKVYVDTGWWYIVRCTSSLAFICQRKYTLDNNTCV